MNIPSSNKKFILNFQEKKLTFEIDQLATNSEKSILCRYGDTTILTVLCLRDLKENENLGFTPLTIFFEEKFYSVGKIPAVFNKREGKPDYNSVTIARLIDRSLRGFFPTNFPKEIQITNSVLSFDSTCDPRIATCWSSFLVCYLSQQLPFFELPLATVAVGKINDVFVCNPSIEQVGKSSLELIITASREKIIMIELAAGEISEDELEKAIVFAKAKISEFIDFFDQIFLALNVQKIPFVAQKETINAKLVKKITKSLEKILIKDDKWIKKENEITKNLAFFQKESASSSTSASQIEIVYYDVLQELMKQNLLLTKKRIDGRKTTEIRPLTIQADYLPSVHGSALFARGQTQVLSVITLGKGSDKQLIDNIFVHSHKHFIHHYNFPAFAVNEMASFRNTSRREIGHGQLVEKTFLSLLPPVDDFPYTVRVVSEVLSSDGSSSQASICATSLALMTAGVPLKRAAAGIALGMLAGEILTDINGIEDKLGEMDFKIAGTEKGICSLQLDVKSEGLSFSLLRKCLIKAKSARLLLIKKMKKHISQPRPQLSTQALKFKKIFVGADKLGIVVGIRGKNINYLVQETGVNVDLQPEGYVLMYHPEEKKLIKAAEFIQRLLRTA